MRCKPDQLCLIIRSIADNRGKIVRTLANHGDMQFWRPNAADPNRQKVTRTKVWSVEDVHNRLSPIPEWLRHHLKTNYGPKCGGLFADEDLLPLNNPDLADLIIQETISDIRDALARHREKRKSEPFPSKSR